MTPSVAILVLNWNGWRDTIECLESLFRLRYSNFTVVLCDNASTDGSVEKILSWAQGKAIKYGESNSPLRHLSEPPVPKPISVSRLRAVEGAVATSAPPARLIVIENDRNAGFAGGTNVGLRYLYAHASDFCYVWILNNDIVAAPDCLDELVNAMRNDSTLGAVGPTLFEYRSPAVVQVAGGGEFRPLQGFPRPTTSLSGGSGLTPLGYVGGGCMLAPVDLLARIGTIDESYFMYCEDVDFSLRIRATGRRLAHVGRAHAWHKGGASTGYATPKHDYYVVRNNLYIARKYARKLMPLTYAHAVTRFVLPKLIRRQRARLNAVLQAFADYRNGIVGPMPPSSTEYPR